MTRAEQRYDRALPKWQAAMREGWLHDHPDKTPADYEIAGTCSDTEEGERAHNEWYTAWYSREGAAIHRRLFGRDGPST